MCLGRIPSVEFKCVCALERGNAQIIPVDLIIKIREVLVHKTYAKHKKYKQHQMSWILIKTLDFFHENMLFQMIKSEMNFFVLIFKTSVVLMVVDCCVSRFV